MVINYRDHLLDACNYAKFNQVSFQNPGLIDEPQSFYFEYTLNCDIELLNKQAALFASELMSNRVLFKCVKDNYYGKREDCYKDMMKLYKYSFFKTFLVCNEISLSDRFSVGTIIEGNRIFWGHKELYLNFLAGRNNKYHRITSLFKTELRRRLLISYSDKKSIEEDEVYKENYDAIYPCFLFNHTYERIMEALSEHKEHIAVTTFTEGKMVVDPEFSPLGSCFFEADGESISYARTGNNIVDFISKFWNTANFIKISSKDPTFDDTNQPFGTTLWATVNKKYVYAEVQAITGLNCMNKFSNQGNVQNFGAPGNAGIGGNPKPPKNDNGNGKPGPKPKPNGKKGVGDNMKEIAGEVKNKIMQGLDNVMRNPKTGNLVADAVILGLKSLANMKEIKLSEQAQLKLIQEYINTSGRRIQIQKHKGGIGGFGSEFTVVHETPLQIAGVNGARDTFDPGLH